MTHVTLLSSTSTGYVSHVGSVFARPATASHITQRTVSYL